jgi:hypothetical protein
MTGLEGPALTAGGGRLLGGLAAPVGLVLARKITFPRLVWWRVRKVADFSCQWRTSLPGRVKRPCGDASISFSTKNSCGVRIAGCAVARAAKRASELG